MPKSKKQKKENKKPEVKAEKEKIKEIKETSKKTKVKEEEEEILEEVNEEKEKSLEEDVSNEEIQTQRFKGFSASLPSAPVLEKIADASNTSDIDWGLSESREEKKEPARDYSVLEEGVSSKYATIEPGFANAPVLMRVERIDISSVAPEPINRKREVTFFQPPELSLKKEDYEFLNRPSGDFVPGKEKEKIGREYKPKHR